MSLSCSVTDHYAPVHTGSTDHAGQCISNYPILPCQICHMGEIEISEMCLISSLLTRDLKSLCGLSFLSQGQRTAQGINPNRSLLRLPLRLIKLLMNISDICSHPFNQFDPQRNDEQCGIGEIFRNDVNTQFCHDLTMLPQIQIED